MGIPNSPVSPISRWPHITASFAFPESPNSNVPTIITPTDNPFPTLGFQFASDLRLMRPASSSIPESRFKAKILTNDTDDYDRDPIIEDLVQFLKNSPTAWNAVQNISDDY